MNDQKVHYHEICVPCGPQLSTEFVRAICTQIQQQTKWCLSEKSEDCKCRFNCFHPRWGDSYSEKTGLVWVKILME